MMLALMWGLAWAAEPPDRSVVPQVQPSALLDHPDAEFHQLRPGLRLWHLPSRGMRDVEIRITFRRGSLDLAQPSSASYTAFGWVWDQATRARSADEVEIYEDLNEVDVATYSGLRNTTISLSATVESWKMGLPLLRDVLVEPRFRRRDLRLISQNRQRWLLIDAPTLGYALVEAALDYGWYPSEHPFGARPDVAGWMRLSRGDVLEHHRDLLRTAPADVLVVGDLAWSELEAHLGPVLAEIGVEGSTEQPPLPSPPPGSSRIIAVDMGGTQRASIGLQLAAPKFTDPEYPAFVLMDHALGGSFLSRLNRSLREEKGLTYGISSTYGASVSGGRLRIETEVAVENVGETMVEIEGQLALLGTDGLEQSEIDSGVAAATQTWNNVFATVSSVDQRYWSWLARGRSVADGRQIVDSVLTITPEDTRRVGSKYLGTTRSRLWVVVGSRAELEPQLSALNLDVQWVPSEMLALGIGVEPAE